MTPAFRSGTHQAPEQRGAANSNAAPECTTANAAPQCSAAVAPPEHQAPPTCPTVSPQSADAHEASRGSAAADASREPGGHRQRSCRIAPASTCREPARGLLSDATTTPEALPDDRYLSLRSLSAYSGLSVRSLRAYLQDPMHPLPHFRPGGKVLVRRSDFDRWMARYRVEGDATDIDAIVREVMDDVV